MNVFLKVGLMLVMFLFCACAAPQTHLVQTDFGAHIGNVKKVGVMVPTSFVNVIQVGGTVVLDKEASTAAKFEMGKGIVEGLNKSGFQAKVIEEDDLALTKKGWVPIAKELRRHFPNPPASPTVESKISGFDEMRKKNDIDCLLVVEGISNVSSAGRKSLMVAGSLIGVGIGQGLSHYVYIMFCGTGRPEYYDVYRNTNFFIGDKSDMQDITAKLTEKMKEVSKSK